MRRSITLVTFVAVGSLVAAACGGGDDDSSDVPDPVEEQVEDSESEQDAGRDDEGDSTVDSEAVFGDLISGTIGFSGAEDVTYVVGDAAYKFTGAGGCSAAEFGISVNTTETDTGYTVFQLDAAVDADLNGGGTGTFEVEEMTLLAVTDGDFSSSRTYEGPGTVSITEHDTGGADNELNERRMAITMEGSLEAGSEGEGTVDVSADFVWVMGCP